MVTPETKTVLITVKAPPNPSKEHQETNCCAGIDLTTGEWVRLYPIPFRLLDNDKKFPKYDVISVSCTRPRRDKRVESWKVDQDSIRRLRHVGPEAKWAERKRIILPTISNSFCKILDDIEVGKSLGGFKPVDVDFEVKKSVPKDERKRRAVYEQYRLFDSSLMPAEQIPLSFYYTFKCYGVVDCPGHKLMIHDWELYQSYRSWRDKYKGEDLLLEKIRQKWLHQMCGAKRDTYFYAGNVWRRPKQFMVLGVFWPPK